MYENSIWSFFEMNALTWSIFETRICTWSIFQWRDRYVTNGSEAGALLQEAHAVFNLRIFNLDPQPVGSFYKYKKST